MKTHEVAVCPPGKRLARPDQLAWKIAEVAADDSPLDDRAAAMALDRIIDNSSVAIAAINRAPVVAARTQALAFPRAPGAMVYGLPADIRADCCWAAYANATAVRELDYHDNFFAHESSHPGDTIAPLIAVAQQSGIGGPDLIHGIVTAYEIQVDLVKGIALYPYRIDHVAHLGPAVAAGLGAMLRLDAQTIYQAVQQAAHVSLSTRQVRKGTISSWKANAPGHVGKAAIEAVDRAMRGEAGPSPIYEGDYGIIAVLLGGPDAVCSVPLPEPGEPKQSILETYPKEHSAGYHGQALIDLAITMGRQISDFEAIESIEIRTKRLTHLVMGSGAGDPEKWDPETSRETLDHSAMFLFTVALQDGAFHHERSYARERVRRPDTVRLWKKVQTVEDEEWNRRFTEPDPLHKDHGARVVVKFADGTVLSDEITVANAHPRGAQPFQRSDYIEKFHALAADALTPDAADAFLQSVGALPQAGPGDVAGLCLPVRADYLVAGDPAGLFRPPESR